MTIRNDLLFIFERCNKSFDFKLDNNYIYTGNKIKGFSKQDYHNNTKNNSLDREKLIIVKTNEILYENNKLQTVANYPLAEVDDTIAVGEFFIMCFVNQGQYKEPIHAIVRARDMKGHYIDDHSMDIVEKEGRHLLHSKYYFDENTGQWKEPTYVYSKACFIRSSVNQLLLNKVIIEQVILNIHKDNNDYILIPARLQENG